MNPIRWWIRTLAYWAAWFFRWRHLEARPRPRKAPRCLEGHILLKGPGGDWCRCRTGP